MVKYKEYFQRSFAVCSEFQKEKVSLPILDCVSEFIKYSHTGNEPASDEIPDVISGSYVEMLPIEEEKYEDLDGNSRAIENLLKENENLLEENGRNQNKNEDSDGIFTEAFTEGITGEKIDGKNIRNISRKSCPGNLE